VTRAVLFVFLLLAGCAEVREVMHLGQPAGQQDEGRR